MSWGDRAAEQYEKDQPSARGLVALVVVTALLAGCNDSSTVYDSCKEAESAGVRLPLTPDSPGWNPKLDRDHNGEACG